MTTPPDELQKELQRLKEEIRRMDEELRRLREQRTQEEIPKPGLMGLAGPPEEAGGKPVRREGETRGQYIARLRRYYEHQRRMEREKEREALVEAARAQVGMPQLPPIPTQPLPGESRADFLVRVRNALQERERIMSEVQAQVKAKLRAMLPSTLTQQEIETLSQRSEEGRRRAAVRLAATALRYKALAENYRVPLVPEPDESPLEFEIRVQEALKRKTELEEDYLSIVNSLRNELTRVVPGEEEIARLEKRGLTPEQIREAISAMHINMKEVTASRRSKEFAFLTLSIMDNPTEYGLAPDGRSIREVAREAIQRASLLPPAPRPIETLIEDYKSGKEQADAIVRKASDMLSNITNQVVQWIGYRVLAQLDRLPSNVTEASIPTVSPEEFERQAKEYLITRGGLIGNIDHTPEIMGRVIEAGPPPVIGPPEPTDPGAIIEEATAEMLVNYRRYADTMRSAENEILARYGRGAVDYDDLPLVIGWARDAGITLPPLPPGFGSEELLFANDPAVQQLIEKINRYKEAPEGTPERRALIQIVGSLFAATIRTEAETPEMTPQERAKAAQINRDARRAEYILRQTGLI